MGRATFQNRRSPIQVVTLERAATHHDVEGLAPVMWNTRCSAGVGRPGAGPPRSVREILEQARLQVLGLDPAPRRHQRSHFTATDETSTTELDALKLAGTGPRADRRWLEVDVRARENLRGLGERDPICCRVGHSSVR